MHVRSDILLDRCGEDLQEQVVYLEAKRQEDEHSKGSTEAGAGPVISWLRDAESCHERGGPDPPGTL